jgi:hypothetical protein
MPTLPPGTDQTVNPGVTPTWVFSPVSAQNTTLRLLNTGSSVVWAGGVNVSPFNGFPIPPGSRPVQLQNVGYTVYTCANVTPDGAGHTLAASALPAGSTAFTVSASVSTITAGTVVLLGAAGSQEVVSVKATGGATTTTFTLATATLYDHVASSPATLATAQAGQIRVTAGVV